MIWDVLALRTAMTVSANYRFTVTPRLVLTFLGTLLLGIGSWKIPLRLENRKIRWKARGSLGRSDGGLFRAAVRRFDAGP